MQAERVLVIKLSSLGDLFHALPLVHQVKAHTGAAVDWVVQPEYAPLVGCFCDVDDVLPFPRRSFGADGARFLRRLRARRYEWGIDAQGLLKSALPLRLARADRRIGPPGSREGAGLLYHEQAAAEAGDLHAVDRLLAIGRLLGVSGGEVSFPVSFPAEPVRGPRPHVAFVPRSRWPAKDWPAEHFADLARRLIAQTGGAVSLLGAGGDRETNDRIARAAGAGCVNRAGETSLVQMGGLLADADLVVSVDSGPMHMAAAVGTPVLALFGVTDPRRTGPYGPRHRVLLAREFRDAPDLARRFKRQDAAGAWHIAVEEAEEAALALLREAGAG